MRALARTLAGLACAGALALAAEPRALAQDPSTLGSSTVATDYYSFGSFTPAGFPYTVELVGQIKYPADLSAGPYPVAVLLHGRHFTCYDGANAYAEWPCAAGHTPVDSYKGYDYLGDILASNGVITISVSANGINAKDNNPGVPDAGMAARAQLVQKHLDQWQAWNTAGGYPVGSDPSKFVGMLDLTRVGTMGHSRGGEGVVTHYNYNKSLGSPYGVRAVLPLAPVNFKRPTTAGAVLDVLLGYCDGDVIDQQGIHYYDDIRYSDGGTPKYSQLVMGANHNYFNTIWTPGIGPFAQDDWTYYNIADDPYCSATQTTNKRETPAQQRAIGGAYMAAFFRTYLNSEDFTTFLSGDGGVPASATFADRPIYASYQPTAAKRRDVNKLLVAADLTTNALGGAVTAVNINPNSLCGGEAPQPRYCLNVDPVKFYYTQPHTTASAYAPNQRGLSQHKVGWDTSVGAASITNAIPGAQQDVSGFDSVQFRCSVDWESPKNPLGNSQDFTVTLSDGTNTASTTVSASSVSGQLYYPPSIYIPKILLNTIRIPLSAFSGVDLTAIQSLTFSFDQTATGQVYLSDIAFASAP